MPVFPRDLTRFPVSIQAVKIIRHHAEVWDFDPPGTLNRVKPGESDKLLRCNIHSPLSLQETLLHTSIDLYQGNFFLLISMCLGSNSLKYQRLEIRTAFVEILLRLMSQSPRSQGVRSSLLISDWWQQQQPR